VATDALFISRTKIDISEVWGNEAPASVASQRARKREADDWRRGGGTVAGESDVAGV
jgi:hypothetical protein